jgi:hypothetical protein
MAPTSSLRSDRRFSGAGTSANPGASSLRLSVNSYTQFGNRRVFDSPGARYVGSASGFQLGAFYRHDVGRVTGRSEASVVNLLRFKTMGASKT